MKDCVSPNKQHIWNKYIDRKYIVKGRICGICGTIEKNILPNGNIIADLDDYAYE